MILCTSLSGPCAIGVVYMHCVCGVLYLSGVLWSDDLNMVSLGLTSWVMLCAVVLLHNGCVLNGPASWCLVGILCAMGSVDMVLCSVLRLPSVRGRSPSSGGDLQLAHLCAEAVYTLHTVWCYDGVRWLHKVSRLPWPWGDRRHGYLVVGMGSCMDVLQEGSREKKKLSTIWTQLI